VRLHHRRPTLPRDALLLLLLLLLETGFATCSAEADYHAVLPCVQAGMLTFTIGSGLEVAAQRHSRALFAAACPLSSAS
jgi:hypothetical protein